MSIPEVKTGDSPAGADIEFKMACEKAFDTWLYYNHPTYKYHNKPKNA
jgi:hypothetical protein